MASLDRSVAVLDSDLLIADDSVINAQATAAANAEATTVAGIAEATGIVTEAAGLLNSTVNGGATAGLDIDQTATASATADTTNRPSPVASTGNSGGEAALGDRVLDPASRATLGYIVNASTGAYAATPDSTVVIGTLAGGELLAGSTAFSGFTGNTGGILDRNNQRDDLVVGDDATVDVTVANVSTAGATNTAGDAYATSALGESYGLSQVELAAGNDGTLSVLLDADSSASADSVGDPTASSEGDGADAIAVATAGAVVGIDDLGSGSGDFSFGDNATITARAGSSSDQISLNADAYTETGHAQATVSSERIAGIQDEQSGGVDGQANLLQVGNDGLVTATAYADSDASAETTTGSASASADLGQVVGLQADDVVLGDNGQLQTQAGSTINVTAESVNGITAGNGDATASAELAETRGLDLESLQVGADAIKDGAYGIVGRTDADLVVTASSSGADSDTDEARALGLVGDAVGVELGDGNGSAGTRKALSVGRNASLAGVAELTNVVSASSIDGRTDAVSFVGNDDGADDETGAIGVNLSDDMQIGAAADLLADAAVTLSATATNVGEQTEAADAVAAAGADYVAGLDARNGNAGTADNPQLRVGTSATVVTGATADLSASATSVSGDVTAEAGTTSGLAQGLASGDALNVVGLASDGAIVTGEALTLTSDADVDLDASGSTVHGDSRATSSSDQVVGLLTRDLVAGTVATITTTADQKGAATAGSIDGDATATAAGGSNAGFQSSGDLSIGTNGLITAQANLDLDTTATTVGDASGSDAATATSGEAAAENVALDLDGGTSLIGSDGRLVGRAQSTADATATGTTAAATATVLQAANTGVDLTGQSLQFGQEAAIGAGAFGVNTATATSVEGDTTAEIAVAASSGLGDGDGTVLVGSNAVIDADASVSNTAEATNTKAVSGPTRASVDNDLVQAINLDGDGDGLTVGLDLALDADAVSSQQATASTIGSPGGSDEAAEAVVALNDNIKGITSTDVAVGRDVSQFTVSSSLSGSATANNMSGGADARAGVGAEVRGMDNGDGDGLVIGRNAVNGLRFEATSNLEAQAVSIEDAARALVGSSTSSGGVADLDGNVAAVHSSAIQVGGSAGTITAVTNSALEATATTNGTAPGEQSAIAQVAQQADGVVNSGILVGYDGNVAATTTLTGVATASNIGQTETTVDAAVARLRLDGDGIDQGRAGDDIVIGAEGNVNGRSFLDGGATAESISGQATTSADLDGDGISLGHFDADITIGEAGNINGLAVLGKLIDGVFSDQIDLIASSVSEAASVNGSFSAAGVRGSDAGAGAGNQTVLAAGPLDGDVQGQAIGGGRLVASSTGDAFLSGRDPDATATASVLPSELVGLRDADIFGGQVGTNAVRGTAFGKFDTLATSTRGDALANSDVDAYGIFDQNGDGVIRTAGNLQAIATLTNNVLATTVHGNATASATSDAVGLSGYTVELIGGGTLTATASSTAVSSSTSVHGRAGS